MGRGPIWELLKEGDTRFHAGKEKTAEEKVIEIRVARYRPGNIMTTPIKTR